MKRAATSWSSASRLVPRRHPGRAGRQLGARRAAMPELELAGEGRVAPARPSPSSNWPAVALDPLRRRVVRRVARAGGEVEEERLLGVDGAQVAEVLDGAVGQVLAEVVALVERARRLHRVVVVVQRRARTGASRRRGSRTSGRSRGRAASCSRSAAMCVSSSGVRCHLPTAYGRVAVRAQDLGEEAVLAAGSRPSSRGSPMARSATRPMPLRVVVAPGEQAGAGRRAQRGGVEVGEPDAARRRGGRCSASRCRSRSSRAARSRRRRARSAPRSARRRAARARAATTASSRASRCRSSPGTPLVPHAHPSASRRQREHGTRVAQPARRTLRPGVVVTPRHRPSRATGRGPWRRGSRSLGSMRRSSRRCARCGCAPS